MLRSNPNQSPEKKKIMKKIIIAIVVAGISILMFQKCTPTVDTAKEMARIDSMANAELMLFRDSLKMNCMDSVMAWGRHKADSMWAAALKAGKPKPKPVVEPIKEVKKDEGPVSGKKGMDTSGIKVTGKKGVDTSGVKVTGKKGVDPK